MTAIMWLLAIAVFLWVAGPFLLMAFMVFMAAVAAVVNRIRGKPY
jgi:hypothetical protein